MDSITQAALGGLCGEIVLRRKLGNSGMVWGLFFGTLPDLDVLFSPFLDQAGALAFHRGVSHSILAMLVGAVLFGWLLSKVHRKQQVSFKEGAWFVFLAWSTHVLIDCFTVYGTQVFAPFDDARISFDNLFIIDLFFTGPMLLGLLLVLFMKRDGIARHAWSHRIVIWLCGYVALSFGMQTWARSVFEARLEARGAEIQRIQVAPTLSNIFLWRMVAETEDGFLVGYWTPWDGAGERKFSAVRKHHELVEGFEESRDFQTLQWFSKGWFIALESGNEICVADMRFGEIRTEVNGTRLLMPTFRWNLVGDGGNAKISDHGMQRPDVEMKPLLLEFIDRLAGGSPHYMEGKWR